MNLGLTEMIFLFLLGLLLFGPKKLPGIGRQLGKALMEFKRASTEFQSQLNDEVRKLELEEDEGQVSPPANTTARGAVEPEPGTPEHSAEAPSREETHG